MIKTSHGVAVAGLRGIMFLAVSSGSGLIAGRDYLSMV